MSRRGALATITEAAVYLGIPRASMYRAVKRGEFPVVKLAGKQRIAWKVLESIAAGGRAEAVA